MSLISFEDWRIWSKTHPMLPYVEKIHLDPQSVVYSWEKAWEMSADDAFVLESGKAGRYTFLGLQAISTVSGTADKAVIEDARNAPQVVLGKPLDVVKRWLSGYRSPRVAGLPKFVGGIVGYWGYDVVRSIERLPSIARADLSCPDYYFMMLDRLWILDQQRHELWCAVHTPVSADATEAELRGQFEAARAAAADMHATWEKIMAAGRANEAANVRLRRLTNDIAGNNIGIDVEAIRDVNAAFSKAVYMAAVRRIQEYIRSGDVFQVNLSVRQSKPLERAPERIYEWLRHLNPSPYMGFLKFGNYRLVSGSPELLVQLEGDRIRTRPIAGTRPRGGSPEEDERIRRKLLANEKERAEHIMLVDLERNDLGRISRYGTVRVEELMAVELYSHVMHIVSEVTGELMPGKDAFDVIAATFPGGTITGAPKIRTMEIIDELEPVRRGPYTGSIGWIDYNGNMEFNIVIRTMLAEDGVGYVQAGAGIVIDSDPAWEYTESLNKAKAMWKAVQYASAEEEE